MNRRKEVSGELVVSGGDAAKVLEAAEHTFDEVALTILDGVIRDQRLAPSDRGDDGFDVLPGQQMTQLVGVVSFVGEESSDRAGEPQQRGRHRHIVLVAGREQQNPRPTGLVAQRVEGCCSAAARAADRLLEGPPFPPPAERCALMWVLSIAAVPMTPVLPVTAANMASQMP